MVADCVATVGIGAILVGCYLIYPPLALIAGGVVVVCVALLLTPKGR